MVAAPLLLLALTSFAGQADAAPPSRQFGEHAFPIARLGVSPNGKVLITAARGEMHAWDLEREELLWKAKTAPANLVVLDVGDELVAFHHGMALANLLHLETGAKRSGIGGTTGMSKSDCIAIDPKDRWIWIGTDAGVVTRVVPDSVNSWSNCSLNNGGITCLAMDAKGKTLVVGGSDATIRFVGGTSANVDRKKVLEGHSTPVTAVAVDAKGAYIVSGSESGNLRVWKYPSGRSLHVLDEHPSAIQCIAVDAKAKHFASGDADGTVTVWNLKKGQVVLRLAAAEGKPVTGLTFIHKGKTLVTAGGSGKVTLWDLSDL